MTATDDEHEALCDLVKDEFERWFGEYEAGNGADEDKYFQGFQAGFSASMSNFLFDDEVRSMQTVVAGLIKKLETAVIVGVAKGPQKPHPRPSEGTSKPTRERPPGVIEDSATYTQSEFCRRAGLGRRAFDAARRRGLETYKSGKRLFIVGRKWRESVRKP